MQINYLETRTRHVNKTFYYTGDNIYLSLFPFPALFGTVLIFYLFFINNNQYNHNIQ
jgi:hypothetical protein